jgi:hypothetical protein
MLYYNSFPPHGVYVCFLTVIHFGGIDSQLPKETYFYGRPLDKIKLERDVENCALTSLK